MVYCVEGYVENVGGSRASARSCREVRLPLAAETDLDGGGRGIAKALAVAGVF
jgi:hypothetical protein